MYQDTAYGDRPPYAPGPGSQEERSWAAAAHAVPLACFLLSAGTLGFVVSVVVWFVARDRGPLVRQHAANALNVQLSALIYALASGVLIAVGALLLVVLVGVVPLVLGVLGVVSTIGLLLWVHVRGTLLAWRGQGYRPPFTIRFVR